MNSLYYKKGISETLLVIVWGMKRGRNILQTKTKIQIEQAKAVT